MKYNILIIIFLMAVISPHGVPAQNRNDNNFKAWVDAGLGYSLAGSGPETSFGGGLAGRIAAHIQFRRVVISVPVTANTGGKSNYDAFLTGKMRDEYFDAGLLIGYLFSQSKKGQLVAAIGLADVWGRQVRSVPEDGCFSSCSDGQMESINRTISVPLELGFYSSGKSIFGYSFVTHLNFNSRKTFIGFTLNLMLGDRN